MAPLLLMMQQPLGNWSVCSGWLSMVAVQRLAEMPVELLHFIWVCKYIVIRGPVEGRLGVSGLYRPDEAGKWLHAHAPGSYPTPPSMAGNFWKGEKVL